MDSPPVERKMIPAAALRELPLFLCPTWTHSESTKQLTQAKKKYPEWYERRIVQGLPKGSWTASPAVYEWWIRTLSTGAEQGHRYWCIMALAAYAKKCGISRDNLEADAYGLIPLLNSKGDAFTEDDVLAALEAYNDGASIVVSEKESMFSFFSSKDYTICLQGQVAHRLDPERTIFKGASVLSICSDIIQGIPESLDDKKEKLKSNELALKSAAALLREPFDQQDTLDRLKGEYEALTASLSA